MTGFLGEYEVRLDAKGRFLLPAGFKKQITGEASSFVLNRGFEKCLSLYPNETWEPLFQKLSQLNDFDPEIRNFRRYFLNGATPVDLDTAGRILIPKHLIEYAELDKEILLVADINKIEIWSKKRHEEFFDKFSPEWYSQLGKMAMSKKPEE